MNFARTQRTYDSPFHYGDPEQAFFDANYASPLPDYVEDKTNQPVNHPEKTYTEILIESGYEIWTSFKKGLIAVSTIFVSTHAADDEVKLLSVQPAEQLKKNFSTSLFSVSSIRHTEGKKLTAHLYDREQLVSVFKQIKKDLSESDSLSDLSGKLKKILHVIKKRREVKYLSIEEKAILSLYFRKLADNCQSARESKKEKTFTA